jgi:hypothetical protein
MERDARLRLSRGDTGQHSAQMQQLDIVPVEGEPDRRSYLGKPADPISGIHLYATG